MSTNSVQGQCYCGSIKFELSFPTLSCSHCHCEDCRHSHGSAFVTWTDVPKEQFKFLSSENKIKKHESHPGIRWWFCRDCGTSLLYDCDDTPQKLFAVVASLTGPLDREPECHFSFEEKVPWLVVSDSLPKYKGKSFHMHCDDSREKGKY